MLQALRKAGILGLNRRNRDYLLRCNERRLFPLVDDKLATKRLCQAKGIPVPELIGNGVWLRQSQRSGVCLEVPVNDFKGQKHRMMHCSLAFPNQIGQVVLDPSQNWRQIPESI